MPHEVNKRKEQKIIGFHGLFTKVKTTSYCSLTGAFENRESFDNKELGYDELFELTTQKSPKAWGKQVFTY